MDRTLTVRPVASSVATGAVAGVICTLSPLMPLVAAGAAGVVWIAGRGLPVRERRWIRVLFVAAFLLRAAAVGAVFLASPHDDLTTPVLFGDEAYAQARALRLRNIALGVPAQKTDYVLAYEDYGHNSYIELLAGIYLLFGPSPYAARLLNSVVFLAAAAVLFRIGRGAYGPVAAFGSVAILLCLPTLFMWSIALLKEPLYFAGMAGAVGCTVAVLRRHPVRWRAGALAAAIALARLVGSLRPGAGWVVTAGAVFSAVLMISTRTAVRVSIFAMAAIAGAGLLLQFPPVRQRVMIGVEQAASIHVGHVFTVGHAYKLLDETAYITPRRAGLITLSEAEGARFVVRAIASFILVPLPWQIATRGELVLLPEHLLWYSLVALALTGVTTAFRRDPIVTAALLGHALVAAAAVAFTNGNVGTLLRFRGLVTPYIVWIALVGFCTVIDKAASVIRPAFGERSAFAGGPADQRSLA